MLQPFLKPWSLMQLDSQGSAFTHAVSQAACAFWQSDAVGVGVEVGVSVAVGVASSIGVAMAVGGGGGTGGTGG